MSITHRGFFLTILACIILKIILAVYLPLLNDEAYAIAVSKEFSLSFFDHPPIGFWLASLFTDLSGLQKPFLFRLPYILCGIGTTYTLFLLGKEVGNHSVGLWSALIYSVAPFFMVSGGFLIVPDGPLNLAIVLSALCIINLHKGQGRHDNLLLILLGICLAFSFASKYQGFLFGLGCVLVLVTSPKRGTLLVNPYFYLCALISFLGLIPTLVWNLQHEWASFQFHGARQGTSLHADNFLKMLLGTMIYLLPTILLIPIFHFISFFSKIKNWSHLNLANWQLLLMAIPNILVFTLVFLFSPNTFPHWIMPGWLLLVPLVGKVLGNPKAYFQKFFFVLSVLTVWPILGSLIIHSQTGFLTNHKAEIPTWDNTIELIDWSPLKKPIEELMTNYYDMDKPKLAALTWMEAGQLSTVMQNKFETLVIDSDPHHFLFLKKSPTIGKTFLVKLSLGSKPDISSTLVRIKKFDEKAIHLKNIILSRGKRNYATASIYLLNK